MKAFAIVFVLTAGACVQAPDSPVDSETSLLPEVVRASLDKRLGTWSLAYPSDEVVDMLETHFGGRRQDLALLRADFDGDDELDIAVLVRQQGKEKDTLHLLAFLRRGDSYKEYPLFTGSPSGDLYLRLAQKGSRAHDFDADRDFVYDHDTVVFCHFEKAATSYVYKDGAFTAVLTED
ncbi:MAG: hypothetical protein K1Y02_11730 [Candidatus Hydrogenedentes bacterium]|nr:hypothetical protein [Candidatus Hydrogenedentota bacterium]